MPDLLEQYKKSSVESRKFTGCGFITQFNTENCVGKFSVSGRIDDVKAVFPDSEEYYFILYVENGKIDALEGFATLNDEWKYCYEDAQIKFCFDEKRDYDLH